MATMFEDRTAEHENARRVFAEASKRSIRGEGFDWYLEYSYPEAPDC